MESQGAEVIHQPVVQPVIHPWRQRQMEAKARAAAERHAVVPPAVSDVPQQEPKNSNAPGRGGNSSAEASWMWRAEEFPELPQLHPDGLRFNPRSRAMVERSAWQRQLEEEDAPQWEGRRLEPLRIRAKSAGPVDRKDLIAAGFLSPKRQRMPRFTGRLSRRSRGEASVPVEVLEVPQPDTEAPEVHQLASSPPVASETEAQLSDDDVEAAAVPTESQAQAEEEEEEKEEEEEEEAEEEEEEAPEIKPAVEAPEVKHAVEASASDQDAPEEDDAEVALLASKLAASAEAVKAASTPDERRTLAAAFKTSHAEAVRALQRRARASCGPGASELEIASEVALQLSLLQMQSSVQAAAAAVPRDSAPVPAEHEADCRPMSSEDPKLYAIADVNAADRNSFSAPPTSNYWDFPLSRHEKKARVFMINQRFAELERMSLVGEIQALREAGRDNLRDDGSDCSDSD